MLETAAGVVANASGDEREAVAMAMSGAYGAVKLIALPLAEHRDAAVAERDALAAEVARLKAILECGSSPYGMHRCCHCDSEVT